MAQLNAEAGAAPFMDIFDLKKESPH